MAQWHLKPYHLEYLKNQNLVLFLEHLTNQYFGHFFMLFNKFNELRYYASNNKLLKNLMFSKNCPNY